jgi:hypothetical protein
MSVISAYTDGVDTWIASDTAGVCSSGAMLDVGPKWCGIWEQWVYGHVGDQRVANIIDRYSLRLFHDLDDPLYLPERMREVFEREGLKPTYDGAVPNWPLSARWPSLRLGRSELRSGGCQMADRLVSAPPPRA